jgi:hypothetical protein
MSHAPQSRSFFRELICRLFHERYWSFRDGLTLQIGPTLVHVICGKCGREFELLEEM